MFFIKANRHLLELSTLTLWFSFLSLGLLRCHLVVVEARSVFGSESSSSLGMFAERMLTLVCLHFLYIEIFVIFIPLELMYV